VKQQVSTLRFRGRSEHSLDAKGRLNIPSRFREVLRDVYSETVMVTNWQKSLKAFPVEEWERLEEKLIQDGRNHPGMGDFVRYVISGVTACTLDKQGRILLPPALRSEFGIGREVVLNGMLENFEIWNKADWQLETQRTRERFVDFDQSLSALGIM